MGLFSGALTLRRYHVEGEVPEDFRVSYIDALNDHAFHEPAAQASGAEISGWCRVDNLLETRFDDLNTWLFNQYIVAAVRTDKKVIPSKLFQAHLAQRVQAWCIEQGRAKAPTSVRQELRELLELEMLGRTLPRVQVVEFAWNLVDAWLIVHSTSDAANDRLRTLFRNTFGLTLTPFSPIDFITDADVAARLEMQGISDYRPSEPGPTQDMS